MLFINVCLFLASLEQVWQELMQAAAPGEPLVSSTLALEEVSINAHLVQLLDHSLCAEVLLGATTQEEIVNLLVEVWTIEYAVSNSVDIHAEQSA